MARLPSRPARQPTQDKLSAGVFRAKQLAGQRRTSVLFFGFFALCAVLIFRLFTLQVIEGEKYTALATGQQQFFEDLVPKRGTIFVEDPGDGGLLPIATTKEFYEVYAVPRDIEDPADTAVQISEFFQLDLETLVRRFSKEGDLYEPITHRVSEEDIERLQALELSGIAWQPEEFRYYPEESFAAHILGFVQFDGEVHKGQYGIEGAYNDLLSGRSGFIRSEKDALGRFISLGGREFEQATDGSDVVLTLNRTLQYRVEQILQEGVERHEADEGSAIVIDPRTGAILAMANAPTFNPNEYGRVENAADFVNSAVVDLYEPGSTFKPIVMAGAINDGVVQPWDVHYDDVQNIDVGGGFYISNYDGKTFGTQTMTQILENSSNTGMSFVADKLGSHRMYEYFDLFGVNSPTGVDIPEQYGSVASAASWVRADRATRSFGQSFAISALQLVMATSAIANDGVMMRPYVIDRVIHPDGEVDETPIEPLRRVLTEETARTVSQMMEKAMENGGGASALIDGYRLSGKTGTAQVPRDDGIPGYDPSKRIVSFSSFGPTEDPRFVVLVKLNISHAPALGATTAAPMAKEIMQEAIRLLRIPPSEKEFESLIDPPAPEEVPTQTQQSDASASEGSAVSDGMPGSESVVSESTESTESSEAADSATVPNE